jgi:hypothetical protein
MKRIEKNNVRGNLFTLGVLADIEAAGLSLLADFSCPILYVIL